MTSEVVNRRVQENSAVGGVYGGNQSGYSRASTAMVTRPTNGVQVPTSICSRLHPGTRKARGSGQCAMPFRTAEGGVGQWREYVSCDVTPINHGIGTIEW